MWFQQALYPNTPVLNIGGYARIIGYLDPQVFCQANILLVEETAVLRLRLTELDGIAQQSFPLVHPIDVGFYDCSNEADPMQSALSSMQETVSRPFQILAEPLFRFNLYKIADDCHLWLQTFHHLVADGFATALITQRLAALYSALVRGEPIPPPTGVPYSDFVDSDIAYLESTQFERHRHYWKQKFSTRAPLRLFHPYMRSGRMRYWTTGIESEHAGLQANHRSVRQYDSCALRIRS